MLTGLIQKESKEITSSGNHWCPCYCVFYPCFWWHACVHNSIHNHCLGNYLGMLLFFLHLQFLLCGGTGCIRHYYFIGKVYIYNTTTYIILSGWGKVFFILLYLISMFNISIWVMLIVVIFYIRLSLFTTSSNIIFY